MTPPRPGLAPIAGPPRGMRSMWASVEAASAEELSRALGHLAPHVARGTVRRALLQVRWGALLAERTAAEVVRAFVARWPSRVSSWVPICHPGAPSFADLGRFATPPDCHACPFYQGRQCQGLGDEEAPFAGLESGAPALRPVERDPRSHGPDDFAARVPICYWRPEPEHIAAIGAAVRAAGGTLWDLGAGNGFLSALLAVSEGLDVTMIDRLDVYPAPSGVRRIVGDVRALTGPGPAAMLISWPPSGDGFRDVIRRWRPRVVIYARDAEAFCGRDRRHAAVVASASGLRWYGWPADDFAALPGLPLRARWQVRCHQDEARGVAHPTGLLEIRAASGIVWDL